MDVFISHHGNDTKRGFSALLRRDLERRMFTCFLDEYSLQRGDVAWATIKEALSSSKVVIVVLSPRFFESKYCLRELHQCRVLGKKKVVPIFFDIKPDACRPQAIASRVPAVPWDDDNGEWGGLGWEEDVEWIRGLTGLRLEALDGFQDRCIDLTIQDVARLLDRPAVDVLKEEKHIPFGKRPEGLVTKHNVPGVEPLFEGRGELMRAVHEALWPAEGTSAGNRSIVSLWGIRGIGKTQLALKYCHENLRRYGRVLWVDVQGKGAQGGYADLGGDILGLMRAPDEQLEDYVKRIRLTVQNLPERFLMVFDGANGDDTLEVLDQLLPLQNQACHVLVTTTEDWALREHGAVALEVESLSEACSRLLLRKGLAAEALSEEVEKKLDELAERLGYLTIALAGAVPLLKERRLERSPVGKLLEELGKMGGVGPANKLFELSLLSIKRPLRSEEGTEAVCRFATSIAMVAGWCGEGPVGINFLFDVAIRYHRMAHGDMDNSTLEDQTILRKALLRVSQYLPAQLAGAAEGQASADIAPFQGSVTLTCHVLFLEYVRDKERVGSEAAREATLAAVAALECDRETVLRFKGLWDVAVRYVEALSSIELHFLSSLGKAYANYLSGAGGDYKTATTVLESGLEGTWGSQGPWGWEWKLALARVLGLAGEHGRAAGIAEGVTRELEVRDAADIWERLRRSWSIWLFHFGWQDGNSLAAIVGTEPGASNISSPIHLANASLDLAWAWYTLATIYELQRRDEEALRLYQQSLSVRERQLRGRDDLALGCVVNGLANLFGKQRKYAEALPLYQRSLGIFGRALGSDHPNVATVLLNLAHTLGGQGKYEEALPLLQQSLRIKEKALGLDHPSVASSLGHMADLLYEQGKSDEALPVYQQSLQISEKALGPDHPDVATTLSNMARVLVQQGKYEEALPIFERSLSIDEKTLRPDHPQIAVTLGRLANLFLDQCQYDEALPLYQRRLRIQEQTLGLDHSNVATTLHELADLHVRQGKHVEALPLFQRSLRIEEEALSPYQLAAKLKNIGTLLYDQGKFGEALPLYKRAIGIQVTVSGFEHPDTQALRSLMEDTERKVAAAASSANPGD